MILIPQPLQHILPECKTHQEKHWALQFRVCNLVHIVSWHELPWALAAQGLSLCHFQLTHASSLLGWLRPVTYNYPPQMSYVLGTCSILGPTVQLWFQAILKRHTTSSQGLPAGDLTLPHIVLQAVLWDLTKSLHDFRTSIQLVCWQPWQWMSPIGPGLQQAPRAWVAGCVKAPCRHFLVSRITQWLPLLKGNSRAVYNFIPREYDACVLANVRYLSYCPVQRTHLLPYLFTSLEFRLAINSQFPCFWFLNTGIKGRIGCLASF